MPSKKSEILWTQIRHQTDLQKAVLMIADVTEAAINESLDDRCNIRQLVIDSRKQSHDEYIELSTILKGNGNPSKSIIARLERIEENTAKSKSNYDKLIWIVIPIIVSNLLAVLFQLLGGG